LGDVVTEPPANGQWSRPARRRAALSLLLLLTVSAINTAGLVLVPTLAADQPLLLVALRPTPTVLTLVAGRIDLVLLLLVTLPTRLLIDVAYFLAARYGGLALVERYAWSAVLVRPFSRRWAVRSLLAVALFSTSIPVDVALGLGPTRLRVFLTVGTVGALTSTVFWVVVSRSAQRPSGTVVDWFSAHTVLATMAILLAMGAVTALQIWRRGRKVRQPVAREPELPHVDGA